MDRAQPDESTFASARERRPSVPTDDEALSVTTGTTTQSNDENQADSVLETEQIRQDEVDNQGERLISSEKDGNSPRLANLDRSVWMVITTLGYMTLTLYAWVITSILTYRPIGPHHYGVSIVESNNDGWGSYSAEHIHSLYEKSESYYRSARVVQSIVAVLTIPLTSAVCARAAVVFLQRNSGLTMRQMIVLADKGWVEPGIFWKLPLGWKRYGSRFLLYALVLSLLGT